MRANKVHVNKLIENLLPCCNLKIFLRNKILSRSYLIYSTKTFGSMNQIFGRVSRFSNQPKHSVQSMKYLVVKKTIQSKTLVNSSKPVWLTEQKFGR